MMKKTNIGTRLGRIFFGKRLPGDGGAATKDDAGTTAPVL